VYGVADELGWTADQLSWIAVRLGGLTGPVPIIEDYGVKFFSLICYRPSRSGRAHTTEAEFLVIIGTRVFLLVIHNNLH
jgi:hypothetical protein